MVSVYDDITIKVVYTVIGDVNDVLLDIGEVCGEYQVMVNVVNCVCGGSIR